MFSEETLAAARECLRCNIDFALCMMPGSDAVIFMAGKARECVDDEMNGDGFFINTFCNALPAPIDIRPRYSIHDIVTGKAAGGMVPTVTPWTISTSRNEYDRSITSLAGELENTGGKAVISRVICGSMNGADAVAVACEYFSSYPATFRFLYQTSMTGAWLGATPETLLSRDYASEAVETMALAGTRRRTQGAWDGKNIDEHDYVTHYIVDVLRSHGISYTVHAGENVGYGSIEHLCHRITGRYSGPFFPLLQSLSPTPALAGMPLDAALEMIARYERHPRYCYGGYVGISDSSGQHAFVNLRSMHFSTDRYCIYAGGGITRHSVASSEWEETEAKIYTLRSIIMRYSHE